MLYITEKEVEATHLNTWRKQNYFHANVAK